MDSWHVTQLPMTSIRTHSSSAKTVRASALLISALALSILPAAPLHAYDFTNLTALANGALTGQNVGQPVPGFEIRLLHHGELLYHQSFGDWSLNRPANADSSSKTMSGALMMSLVDSAESGFTLDSRLSDFLPEYDTDPLREITIRQSFSHSSGLAGEDVSATVLLNPFITLRQAAFQISQTPLDNGPPGSTFAYGGLSMQAAGAAAEIATGESYVNLFADRIATPLGLSNTEFVLASDSNPRVAGGIESTATDFARFMDMLLNRGVDRATGTRVLSENAVAEMLRRQTTDTQPIANSPTGNNRYGIGIWLDQLGPDDLGPQAGPGVDAIAGGARGFHSWIDQSADLTFAFATDLSSFQNVDLLSSLMHAEILRVLSLPGDFNRDGEVSAADYNLWRTTFGQTVEPFTAADANGNATIDAGDYTVWRDHLTTNVAPTAIASPLPEPTTFLVAAIALLLLPLRPRASRSSI
jgi:CubicO group peptidase (beta-lactamase class C family)